MRAIVEVDDGILIKKIFHRDVASAICRIEQNHHRSRIVARRLIDRVRDPAMAASCVDPSSIFRSAFRWSSGEPLTTTELMKQCYFLLPSRGEKFKSWHRTNITRVAKLLAIRIGRATSKGRPILWSPRLELIQDQRWAGLKRGDRCSVRG